MKTLTSFTIAMVAWVSYKASATETSCVIGSKGSIFLPHQHHALIGHLFLNQSGTDRIKCMMLCFRHRRCLSFNHDDTSGICQLNDASKEEFPESYKHDGSFSYFDGSSNKAKTGQETTQAQTSTDRVTTVSTPTPTPYVTTAQADTEGLILNCPNSVFGLTNDVNALTSVQWRWANWYDTEKDSYHEGTCRDGDKTVTTGDSFKVGTTTITCTAQDTAGNLRQCTFKVMVTVCNIIRLGMESGTIADHQITAYNVLDDDLANNRPALARLNSQGSWCGLHSWPTPVSIQVDFDHTVDIYGLIIQGRYGSDDRVHRFELGYEHDGAVEMMKDTDGTTKMYRAEPIPDGRDIWVSVQTTHQKLIQSKSIRIYPEVWFGRICMRFELLGCN